jgi:hypothetical protein
MTVVVRRIAACPARISSEVWSVIIRLVCRGDKKAEAEFEKVRGAAACLINDESFSSSAMSVRNEGPRLRVYCVYGDDAVANEDIKEEALTWNPTKGDWKAYLPCLSDDVEVMTKLFQGKSDHFEIYDVAKGVPDEETKVEASAPDHEKSAVNWEAFRKL